MDNLLKDQAHVLAEKFTELECKTNDFTIYDGDGYSRVAQAIYDDYFHYSMEELNKLKMEILQTQINKNKSKMNIKDLVTIEQYNQLKKDYNALVKNKNEISFFDFCTKTYKLK